VEKNWIFNTKEISRIRHLNTYHSKYINKFLNTKGKKKILMDKWTLYTGWITSQNIEIIGEDIDLVFIDTVHFTPGEMLEWIMVLPFLKMKQ